VLLGRYDLLAGQRPISDDAIPETPDSGILHRKSSFVNLRGQLMEAHRSAEAWKQGTAALRNAFPDIRITIDDEIAADGKVVQRWTIRGTHQGDFFGVPATGKKVAWPVIAIFRLSGAKIAEVWTQGDTLNTLQQLGAVPPLGGLS
jgi:steroid delta-isomerase-like uncharacterized protein